MLLNPIYKRISSLFLFLFVFSAIGFGQNSTDIAPVLISKNDSTRALTKQNTKVFPPGENTKITLFVTSLALLPNEDKRAFRADATDVNRKRYPLEIVDFKQNGKRPWIYEITLRLNKKIGKTGDVLVRVNWRGMSSNRVRVAVGTLGGKIKDDVGAAPTPFPDQKPSSETRSNARPGLPWEADRVRFMEQATFGANSVLEHRVRRIGFFTWLNEQMEEKRDANGGIRYSSFPYPDLSLQPTTPPTSCVDDCIRDNYSMYPLQNWFFKEALYGEDQQLRRRVSWALSQIWVVSGRETVQSSRMLEYIKVLDKNAFGNYRDLMREMTLNPAMGNYLDMAISTADDPNENFAREILQLFSVGLYQLNQDGTTQLDDEGNPIPTYDQNVVNGFTKIFTGWTFCNFSCPNSQPGIVNFKDPMLLRPENHDTGVKRVLSYPGSIPAIPAGQAANDDFEQALDNIFYHPNVGPFVSKLLIQQMVTSNPTPTYVERVARKFNNNGNGIRGDLKAVVRAILTDPEARGNLKTDPDYGHLREPVLFVTNTLRQFNPSSNGGQPFICNGRSGGYLNEVTTRLDQDVFNPPSVFNYYSMEYTLPGTNIIAPEFGIFSTGTALKRPNFINQMIFDGGIPNGNNAPCGTKVDLSYLQVLIEEDTSGELLVDYLNRNLLHKSMSSNVRQIILDAVQAVTEKDLEQRVKTALYLVVTSPQFQVQR